MALTASEQRRSGLVADLRSRGVIRSDAVAAAFLAVPREEFVAQAVAEGGLEAVYRDEAIVTKRDARGFALSSSSQPALMAEMLELLALSPGDRVLEIGAGTGYNAALLSHIVGPRGRITSVDIDTEQAHHARRSIRQAGYRAGIVAGDGRRGYPDEAPYDRIIVTACADAIPRAWFEQLVPGGRLEVPLRLDPDGAAIQLIPVFERDGSRLRSVGVTWGGFMPLHGGDGGWRPRPPALSASRFTERRPASLVSLSGAGVARLSVRSARALLAALLTDALPARRQGRVDLGGGRPPLLLLYLLLSIPAPRRVSLSSKERVGVGIIHPRGVSVAVVSMRSPWTDGPPKQIARSRWRLEAYGGDSAANDLDQLLSSWQEIQRSGRTQLHITADGPADTLRLSFAWTKRQ
jgi:protein-L-isoaspartate(D-aspartate) O-methyltransferase